jgi:predicted lipoprotein with Yx(FWY)xxD motif
MSTQSRHRISQLSRIAGALGAAGALLLAAACGGSSTSPSASSSGGATVVKTGATSVSTATTSAGKILVDGHGRTMYAFAADTKGHSNCTGACLTYWPPVPASAKPATAASAVTAELGVLHRADGTDQLTANGWPMYTYVGDSKPGSTAGQGKNLSGGLWWVVSPSGSWITRAGASSGKQATSSSGGSGSGY